MQPNEINREEDTIRLFTPKIAGAVSSRNHVVELYECSTCDILNGNKDGNLAAAHFDEENKGRRWDSNMRHQLFRRFEIVEASS